MVSINFHFLSRHFGPSGIFLQYNDDAAHDDELKIKKRHHRCLYHHRHRPINDDLIDYMLYVQIKRY